MIYKTQNTANFTIIDSEILRDESLSMGARMFYALAQSFSDCWNINIKHFAKILGVSEASVRKFRNELVSADILHFEQKRDEKGKLTQESVYTFKGFEVVEQEQVESDYFCHSKRSEESHHSCHSDPTPYCHSEPLGEESIQKSADSHTNASIDVSRYRAQHDKVEALKHDKMEQEKSEQTPLKSSSYPFAQKTAYGYSSDISNINILEKSTLSKRARDSENPQNPQTPKADLKSAESHALCHVEPLGEVATTENTKPRATQSEQQSGEAAQYFGAKIGALQAEARARTLSCVTEADSLQSPILDQKTSGIITRLKVIEHIKTFSDTHAKKQTLKAELNTQNFTQEEQQAFKDFIAYRKERGFLARSTLHSIIRDFEKLKAQNAPIMQCVELCINRGWSGLLKANEALQNYARYAQKPQARPQAQSALSKLTL